MGKVRDLFKKIGNIKGQFHPKMGIINGRNGKKLTEAEKIKKKWKEELWKEVCNIVQEVVTKTICKKK